MKIYRHGDVLIKEVKSLPKRLKKQKDGVLAYGEVTGHSHRFTNLTEVSVFNTPQGQKYLEVGMPSPLSHEEHKTILIDSGKYEIGIEREYDYFTEEMRKVVD